jgi:uncharacterized protein
VQELSHPGKPAMTEPILFAYLFALFSLIGWILEFAFRSLQHKKPVNPGFLTGPYLPIYGTSVVLLTVCIIHFNNGMLKALIAGMFDHMALFPDEQSILLFTTGAMILLKIAIYFIVTSGIELVTGIIFNHVLRRSLWDYSDEGFCIKKLVCLKYSCMWIALSFLYEYTIFPTAVMVSSFVHPVIIAVMSFTVCFAIILDFSHQLARNVKSIDRPDRRADHREFIEIVGPLLEMEELKHLADFKHHLNKTRLDHSLDVAWLSYSVTKRLSCDYTSAARGALLHDLFYYDWATEGPRLHGFKHPRICLDNAIDIIDLNKREKDIIKKHMWPLTVVPPRYPEAWSVCLADTFCGIKDYADGLKSLARTIHEGKLQ